MRLYDIYNQQDFRIIERCPLDIASKIVDVPEEEFLRDVIAHGHCAGRRYTAKPTGVR